MAESPPRPRVVMVLKVRDEEDILERNLRFHHALGVERFIVIDNGSTDGSVGVLERWSEAGIVVWDHRDGDYADEVVGWMQDGARRAYSELGADWVLHGDADELWLPVTGTIPEQLAAIAGDYGAVVAPRSEFVAIDGDGDWSERLVIRQASAGLRPKVAHRGDPTLVMLDRGAHNVASTEDEARPAGGSERAVVRAAHNPGEGADQVRFVWAPSWPLRIMHFPVRSREQLKRRTEVYLYEGAHGQGGRTASIRERFERDGIDPIYADHLPGDEALAAGLADGSLIRDERIRDLIARSPDPLAPGAAPAGSIRVEPAPDELAAERAAIERDTMRDLSRMNYRVTVSQARLLDRIAQLEQRLRRERRRAREASKP